MTKNCPNCGKEIDEADEFCKSCGKSSYAKIMKSEKPIIILLAIVIVGYEIISSIIGINDHIKYGTLEKYALLIMVFLILRAAVVYGLWNLKKWAGILLIIISLYGIFELFNSLFLQILIEMVFWIDLICIILIALGWNKLKY